MHLKGIPGIPPHPTTPTSPHSLARPRSLTLLGIVAGSRLRRSPCGHLACSPAGATPCDTSVQLEPAGPHALASMTDDKLLDQLLASPGSADSAPTNPRVPALGSGSMCDSSEPVISVAAESCVFPPGTTSTAFHSTNLPSTSPGVSSTPVPAADSLTPLRSSSRRPHPCLDPYPRVAAPARDSFDRGRSFCGPPTPSTPILNHGTDWTRYYVNVDAITIDPTTRSIPCWMAPRLLDFSPRGIA